VLAQSADDNIVQAEIKPIGGLMKKVVVAEASPTIKSVADSLLRQNGYDVVCTSDGLQAWEVVSGEKPDIVLVGQGISGISGLDLCRQISNDNITGGIPVVFMSGAKDSIAEEQIVAAGARGKLNKPFSPKDLLDVVERLTGQGNMAPAKASETVNIQQAKFSTQVSSSQHLNDKKESYNLEWLDLNESETSGIIPKVASFDTSSEETALVISDDQYGLSNPQLAPEPDYAPPVNPQKDEDYEWFLGEIKKEMEGKSKLNQHSETDVSISGIQSKLTSKQATESIKFDDIASAGEPRHPAAYPKSRGNGVPAPLPTTPHMNLQTAVEKDKPSSSAAGTLSGEQLADLADRIAARLASQIAARIDKNLIIEAIKAAFKQ
jgi:CheY-like chemotaxis protein